MGGNTWVIGGQEFKVDAVTQLDDGLAEGVEARVEFIKLSDGTLLAIEIEADEDDGIEGTGDDQDDEDIDNDSENSDEDESDDDEDGGEDKEEED